MRRNTSRLIAILIVFYLVGQSMVLFYGHVARLTLFTRQTSLHKKEDISSTLGSLTHDLFSLTDSSFQGGIVKLGNSEKYINVDLSSVDTIAEKSKVYFNFEFRLPHFIDNRSSLLFQKKKENLESLGRNPVQLYGEVYVVRNGTYDTKFDCGYKSQTSWVNKDRKVSTNMWYDALVPLIVPDGHTFQHFLDGTLPKIVQALPVLQNRRVKILMKPLRDKIIFEIFDKLNISRKQLVFHSGGVIGANLLIYPCITPPVHPELWQEGRRLITGLPPSIEADRQGLVVFVTRKGCHNCGRRVLNSDALVDMLNKRYGMDRIRVFEGPKNLAQSIELFSYARIIMGPHGGAMYNINFARSKTAVIEFMPTRENGDVAAAAHQIIWHMAQLLDQDYWRMCIPPSGGSDMNVDITTLGHILDVVDKQSFS